MKMMDTLIHKLNHLGYPLATATRSFSFAISTVFETLYSGCSPSRALPPYFSIKLSDAIPLAPTKPVASIPIRLVTIYDMTFHSIYESALSSEKGGVMITNLLGG